MSNHPQPLRRSQFIFTYGPGSIIETQKGPRLIPSLKTGLKSCWDTNMRNKMEINDVRLCMFLNKTEKVQNKCHIFAIPSNADLSKADNKTIYITQIFPIWKICYNKEKHAIPILYYGNVCPVCHSSDHSGAVRFVAACPDGHLDEVNWKSAVHHSNGDRNCNPSYYEWHAKGSTLSSINIICPNCRQSVTMKEIYNMRHPCTGRSPELELVDKGYDAYYPVIVRDRDKCDKQMRITQRQSTGLHLAQLVTLLTIPEYDDEISNIIQQSSVSTIIDAIRNLDVNNIIGTINTSSQISAASKMGICNYIREYGKEKLLEKYDLLHADIHSFIDMMNKEYHSLINGYGQSGTEHFTMGSPVFQNSLEIIPSLSVCPVMKIRTVTVQRGYTRQMSNDTPKPVSIAVKTEDGYWFPGFEGFGEGIFIHVQSDSLSTIHRDGKSAYENWKAFKPNPQTCHTDWIDICSLPEFVWLHTLSHALIRAISEYTGYSVASIRERVYYEPADNTGGILLYNTVPGDDGSMGGLVDIINNFRDILRRAEELILVCSNDPLCSDVRRTENLTNGSVCYGCLLLSETSCEHGNRWIDRQLFLEDLEK